MAGRENQGDLWDLASGLDLQLPIDVLHLQNEVLHLQNDSTEIEMG